MSSTVVFLRSDGRPASPKADPSRLLGALGVTLRELPARPAGLTSCVGYLQEDPGRVAAKPIAVRALQKFRESLFHSPGRELEMRLLWRESLATACCARLLAGAMNSDAALLTGGGLLHRLKEVLALRSLADAEFRSGQRLLGPVMQELAAARDGTLAERAINEWTLADPLRELLVQWREDHAATGTPEAARQLALAQLLGFEIVHAGRSTPGVIEASCEQLRIPLAVADQVRACSPGIELLLLRAAPSMGPVSVAGLAPAAQPI